MLKFGTMRALVAGRRSRAARRPSHNGLSGLKKDNRGYSLDQLLIGAEGTLGVVTAVALRLVPAIAARAVAWAGVNARPRRSTCCASSKPGRRTSRVSSWCRTIRSTGAEACPGHAGAAVGQSSLERADRSDDGRSSSRRHRRARAAAWRGSAAGHYRGCDTRGQRSAGRSLLETARPISEAERAEGRRSRTISPFRSRTCRPSSSMPRREVEQTSAVCSTAVLDISATATSTFTFAPAPRGA